MLVLECLEAASRGSLIPLELPLARVGHFQIRIEDPFDVTVQRPHDADPGQHRRARLIAPAESTLERTRN